MTELKALRNVFASILLTSAPFALTQSSAIFLRTSPHPEQKWTAQTYSGPVETTASKPRFAPVVTVLLLPDTLTSSDKGQANKELLDRYASFRGPAVQVPVLRGNGEFTPPIAVVSHARFTQLLEKSLAGEDPAQVPSPAVLDDLLSVIQRLGTRGGSLLLVGELPTLDSATTAFASALLIKASTAQVLLLDILSPMPLGEVWSPLFRCLSS
jgi:hypothetical protein